jgi:putative toxin-antitoxin system antitoxin component (TIGR02293 family)
MPNARRNEELLRKDKSRALRVCRTVSMAENVFGNGTKASVWLHTPDERLANRSPLDMLDTESGFLLVEATLWQIDEGVYT